MPKIRARRTLLAELLAFPGVPRDWRARDVLTRSYPVVPVAYRVGQEVVRYFSTVTMLGKPHRVLLPSVGNSGCSVLSWDDVQTGCAGTR